MQDNLVNNLGQLCAPSPGQFSKNLLNKSQSQSCQSHTRAKNVCENLEETDGESQQKYLPTVAVNVVGALLCTFRSGSFEI